MPIKDVKTRHLQDIMDTCGKSSAVKANIKCVMNVIFKYACQNDLVEKNYADFINVTQDATALEREIYTDEEVMRLWDHANEERYAFTLILLHQGMRIKELFEAKIDLDSKTFIIDQAKNAYSRRTIPINKHVYDLVVRLKENPVTFSYVTYLKFAPKLGHLPYDVRHTFATKCNKLGIDPLITQKIMGHKPESILHQVYTHISLEEMSDVLDMVNYTVQ